MGEGWRVGRASGELNKFTMLFNQILGMCYIVSYYVVYCHILCGILSHNMLILEHRIIKYFVQFTLPQSMIL